MNFDQPKFEPQGDSNKKELLSVKEAAQTGDPKIFYASLERENRIPTLDELKTFVAYHYDKMRREDGFEYEEE